MPKLIIQSGEQQGRVIQLGAGRRISVGRSVNNELQVVDRRMSRNHAEVYEEDKHYFMRDLGSKNGSQLNGATIGGPTQLRSGDILQIGDTTLLFEEDSIADAMDSVSSGQTFMGTPPVGRPNQSYKVVDENQWGSTRGEVRAGVRPAQTVNIDTNHGMALKDASKRLEILYQISEAMRSLLDLDQVLEKVVELIQEILKPDISYLLIKNPETNELEPRVVRARDGEDQEVKLSSSIVDKCMADRVSMLVSDAAQDQRFASSESIILNRIRTAMVAPIVYQDEALGVVYVDTRTRMMPYSREELELLTGLTNQAALGIINARLHSQLVEQYKLAREMEIARTIQMNLLPKVYPNVPGYDVSAMSLPAKQVGGDYYDFLELPDDRFVFAVADVSGKGVPAAILTATTRSYLQGESERPSTNIVEAVARMNRMVYRDVTNDMYVTMVYTILKPEDDQLQYVNAGHCHPVLLKPDGTMTFLDKGGLFLGISAEVDYEAETIDFPKGGVLLLSTDGVTDIQNTQGEIFGEERLFTILRENRQKRAEEIRNAIYQSCVRHRGEADQFDDFTLIVLKRQESDSDVFDSGFDDLDFD
ncbi:MAG: SpoIIE family protein phosphatase [Sumerlaeia bacterium]